MKKIAFVLVGLMTVGAAGPLYSAEESAAPGTEETKADETEAYFDYKVAFSLVGDFERGKQLATQSERF